MKHLKTYSFLILLIGSLIFNFVSMSRLKEANGKIDEFNRSVALQVERNIRQSMRFANELMDNPSQQSFLNLQRTLQDLAISFEQWVTINQRDRNSNMALERGLSGIEAMRNVVVHHLNNQFIAKDYFFDEYDLELIQRVHDNLDRLLMVYFNINERLPEVIYADSDGGLVQLASNIEEMTRLYRHSITPNQYPNYASLSGAMDVAVNQFPFLSNYRVGEDPEILIREGVHSYQLEYYKNKDLQYLVAVDAINYGIRNFEVVKEISNKRQVSSDEALTIATEYLHQFYQGEVVTEFFEMPETTKNNKIYAFRFTPIVNEKKMVSDAFNINVSSCGQVVKYSNDFTDTNVPNYTVEYTIDEIIESNRETYGEMNYNGVSVVRSFLTRYKPRVTYSFKVIDNEQQMLLFFDVETGKQIYNIYYIYEPVI